MPISLEHFRQTCRDVDDIGRYNGHDYGEPRRGCVYMDGRYSIERDADGWRLTIANMGYVHYCIEPLEIKLYEWMLTECESLMAFPFRLAPLPIDPTEAEVSLWLHGLAHTFPKALYPNEAEALQQSVADICRCRVTRTSAQTT